MKTKPINYKKQTKKYVIIQQQQNEKFKNKNSKMKLPLWYKIIVCSQKKYHIAFIPQTINNYLNSGLLTKVKKKLFNMKLFIVLACTLALVAARPEPPKTRYGPPPAPQKEYLPPNKPAEQYLPPSAAQQQPAQPLPVYGAPAPFYGPPAEAVVTKNVYVHVPPEEPEAYPPPAPIQTAVPKKHYKIIFIKAPNPPTPIRQVVPPPVQDEHKTLVYVLVKKPEQQEPLVIPSPAPTEPSKPEVYFIKYKQQQKPAEQYGPPAAPASEYGPPAEKF
ncbi:hypothetical protein FF38_09723 [Lucilia cuprina]|uniref:DUF243 domain-containing protein n=2 Tax=Lucilia cuprina TaxID=7375 RepID=A0A0L0CLG8_LUCCU|nr:hypothetical protein CVS40_8248 [Lucilia cuprina]KNC32289.1 hypothetical protein FF38_09723 [Lucilia cuprina]